jgi:Flp pilus assembly protein TadG
VLRKHEQGSALVETAISLAILLTFLFGVIEVSLMLYTYHFIAEAAREGTRYAIVRGSTCTGFPSACPAADTDVENYVEGLGFPGIDSTKMQVTASYAPYPSTKTCSPSSLCNNAGNMVTVTVTYAFPFSIPFVPANTVNMSSTSAMIIAN